jgi:hypothetical protein
LQHENLPEYVHRLLILDAQSLVNLIQVMQVRVRVKTGINFCGCQVSLDEIALGYQGFEVASLGIPGSMS